MPDNRDEFIEALEALSKVAVEKDVIVMSDEIYDKLIYDGYTFRTFASFGDDVKDKSEPNGAALNGHEVRMASDDDSDDVEDKCDEDDQSEAVVASQAEEKPETMLSWSEQPLPDDMKPKCAVALGNDVMFDLDID